MNSENDKIQKPIYFKPVLIIICITLLFLLSPIVIANQEYTNVNLIIIGKTDSMIINGFHTTSSGYGDDYSIFMDFHGPYFDKAWCRIWNTEESFFDGILSFKRVAMNKFTGWIYFQPNFPILFGYCEYVKLSTLRGTTYVDLEL